MALSDEQALQIVGQAWQAIYGRAPTNNEALYSAAIAKLETGYGRAGQFGALAANGQYNWGALETHKNASGDCPPGTAPGSDQGSVCFYVYPSDVDAAKAFIHTLTQTHWNTIPAMQGTPEDVATAMRKSPPYYAGYASTESEKISQYASAIRSNIAKGHSIIPGGGGLTTVVGGSKLLTYLVFGAAAYGTWRWYNGKPIFPSVVRSWSRKIQRAI